MEPAKATTGRARAKTSRFAKPVEKTLPSEVTQEAMNEAASLRQAPRHNLREESSLERAKRRAAELKGSLTSMDDTPDEFAIPAHIIPEGWSYEWKRKSVFGQEDSSYMMSQEARGWEPVPASRHRSMMPEGHYNTIERKGMILMERPKEITDEAKRQDRMRARDAVKSREQQLAEAQAGQFARNKPTISKGYEPMAMPEE